MCNKMMILCAWSSSVKSLQTDSQQFENRPPGNTEGSAQDLTSEAPKLLLAQQNTVESNGTEVCAQGWAESTAPGYVTWLFLVQRIPHSCMEISCIVLMMGLSLLSGNGSETPSYPAEQTPYPGGDGR